MTDIMKKYKKQKFMTNINIVLASFVLALGVNFMFFGSSNLSQYLTTNVLGTEIKEVKSDISIEKFENEYYIVTNKNINLINSLSLSLIYNPENVSVTKIESSFGDIINLSNTPGISSIILTTNGKTSAFVGDKIIKLELNKNQQISENINIVNANFTDINKDHFLLTTSGITF